MSIIFPADRLVAARRKILHPHGFGRPKLGPFGLFGHHAFSDNSLRRATSQGHGRHLRPEDARMWQKLAWLALAGAIGTLVRYGVGGLAQKYFGEKFPWGTLVVNASGCLLFGFVWALAEERLAIRGETRFILLTGFMGAYTTFFTFAFETGALLRDSEWMLAAGNCLGQNLLGVACIFLGFALSRLF
jgi:CrcB protein